MGDTGVGGRSDCGRGREEKWRGILHTYPPQKILAKFGPSFRFAECPLYLACLFWKMKGEG